jgi:hypothetical protein
MARPRAADDFTTIRARMQELRSVHRPRAADDFETIHRRMEELRRERAHVPTGDEARRACGPRPYAISERSARPADWPGLSPVRRELIQNRLEAGDRALNRVMPARIRTLAAREILILTGQAHGSIYRLKSGWMSRSRVLSEGRQQINIQ